MAWLDSDDAVRQARRLAARRGLGGYDAMTDNVLADARVAVWNRMRSATPMQVDNPAGYGTAVIRSVLRQLLQGRDGPARLPDDPDSFGDSDGAIGTDGASGGWAPVEPGEVGDTAGDDVRVLLERADDGRVWASSAALSYLILLLDPTARPDDAPWPRSGATPEQARCWPGLWFAGERELFEEGADARERARLRRSRARRIEVVLDRVQRALATYRMELEADRG